MKLLFLTSLLLLAACSSKTVKNFSTTTQVFTMTNTPIVGETMAGQQIKLGGFSGLQFLEEKNGSYYFQTVTDRGPNGIPEKGSRPFLLPDYSPMIVTLKADSLIKELSVVSEIKLKKKDGSPLTGLPNNRLEENPADVFGFYYSIDPQGLDIEGLTTDGEGGWWVADEYGPSLVRFDSNGTMLRRLTAGEELPRMYTDRKPNRGFEGVARTAQKLFGILQSPLPYEKDFSRIVEINLETNKITAEYFYPFDQGNDKIGDLFAMSENTLLVLEQNGETGEKSRKLIYKIQLGKTDEVVKKSLVADLKGTAFNDMEKIEGIAPIGGRHLAIIYDNDFQISGNSDKKNGLTPLNQSQNQLLILELQQDL